MNQANNNKVNLKKICCNDDDTIRHGSPAISSNTSSFTSLVMSHPMHYKMQ